MDNINDILRAKRIVRQNGYTIKKPARDYDYEREDRMNLIRAKRIVKDAGYSYVKPNDGVSDNSDDFDTVSTRRRYQDDYESRPSRRVVDDFDNDEESFKIYTNKAIHSMYPQLRNKMLHIINK